MRKSQMPNYELRKKRILAPTLAPLTRIRNATLFFALKLQHNLAQGNALGKYCTICMRPVRATKINDYQLRSGAPWHAVNV